MKARSVKQKKLLTLYMYGEIGNFWIIVNVVKLFIFSEFILMWNVTTLNCFRSAPNHC